MQLSDLPDTASLQMWAVVNTQPHREHAACEHLTRQAFEVYFPKVRRRVTHARRTQLAVRPLFPGYVFVNVRANANHWRPIRSTIGVRRVVSFGEHLALLDPGLISGLRSREVDGVIARPAVIRPLTPYVVGQDVRMNGGPLDGMIATILSLDEKDRLTVLMNMLQRSVTTSVASDGIRPIDDCRRAAGDRGARPAVSRERCHTVGRSDRQVLGIPAGLIEDS